MRFRTMLAGAAAFALVACTKPPLDEQQKTALADSIEQYVAGPFIATYNSGNVDSILATYAPGNGVQSASDGKILANRDAIVASTRAMYGNPHVKIHYTLATPQITVLSRDVAVYSTMAAGTGKDSVGVETTMRFAWTGVFVRTPGGWKVQAEHASFPPAPAPAAPAKPAHKRG
ncbi:MAG: nuclear transport factor 2 family protein [Gemmatimonadales bacterium]